MKRKILTVLMVMLLVVSSQVFADDRISVYINEEPALSFDVQPQIVNNRLLVPMRVIFEALGAKVEWNPNDMTIRAVSGNTTITLGIGNNVMYKNNSPIELDVLPQIIDNRTMIPLRAVAEAFGANVAWHDGNDDRSSAESRYVHITTFDCYPEADIPKFDYICGEAYTEKAETDEFIIYVYPLAEYGTDAFGADVDDIDTYDMILEDYGYSLSQSYEDGGLGFMYSNGTQIVCTGIWLENNYGRFVAIRKSESQIAAAPSNEELFAQELLKLQDYYFQQIDECDEKLAEIADRTFEYNPDEDEELQEAMEFAKRQAKRDAVNRGKGNSFGIEYAASEAAKKLIPYYKEEAESQFFQDKRDDYAAVAIERENLVNSYNNSVKKLASNYGIYNYSVYLIN